VTRRERLAIHRLMKEDLPMKLALVSILVGLTAQAAFATKTHSALGDTGKLHTIINGYTAASKRIDPYWATYYNVEEDLDEFGGYLSPEWLQSGKHNVETALAQVKEIDPDQLSAKDRRTYALFKGDLELSLKGYEFPFEFVEFNQMSNRLRQYIDDSSKDLTYFPFDSVKHYDDFVKRSGGFPAYVDRQIGALDRLRKQGYILSCIAAQKTINTYGEGLETVIDKNPFFRPVGFMPKEFSTQDRARIEADFRKMVAERIVPAFKKFDTYFKARYLPSCRKTYGIGELPGGNKWYSYLIEAETDLPLDAREIHDKGLAEVKRIGAEIAAIQKEFGFKGTPAEFLNSVSRDSKHFFRSSEEMFKAFLEMKKRIAPTVSKYFDLTPKGDYKIVDSGNPEEAAGSYHMPTEMQPIGKFVINTHNLKAVAAYDVAALSLHEAIPGHHFQLALVHEMKDQLSEYQRKLYSSNAFVEGWALYAERVGYEMGAYATSLDRLGALNSEMLRAVRLVVDTGIHAMGWPRDRAIAYMTANMAGDPKDIETEADRYSVWPGQALSYKIGQLKILELRAEAEAALGSKFDIRGVHRAVIGNGTVSLPILETQVREWIKSQSGNGT
jgi:uncharacterized protein (DUF885 family)